MPSQTQLGLRENWAQFTLLVIINGFVGAMVGLERSIFPSFANERFGIESASAILSFILAFGFAKAIGNYFTGRIMNALGRKKVLLLGWTLALPIPWLLIWAPDWNWVVFINVLLGLSQGFAWSATIVMKIDLVGPKDRGFAMGLNEFAGYFSVGVMAFVTGHIANNYGIHPYPFYIGIGIALLGWIVSAIWVQDTHHFVAHESETDQTQALKNVFKETTFTNKTLSSVTQAGLVNNLNDGMIWGLFPLLLLSLDFSLEVVAVLTAIYPSVWGMGQLVTGKMSDHVNPKKILFWGMFMQSIAILLLVSTNQLLILGFLSALLGLGTALVYPTFLHVVAANTQPLQRAESLGTFRLWRDLGYVFGALLSGIIADFFGLNMAIFSIGLLTLLSAGVIAVRMPSTKKTY
jgi:MFS family permease